MENRLIFDNHPSEDIIEEYAFNRLPEADCAEFEEHLLICPHCQNQLAETDQYIRVMKRAAADRLNSSSAHAFRAKNSRLRVVRSPIAAILGAVAFTAALTVAIPHYSWRPLVQESPAELVALRGGTGPALARARAGTPIGFVIDTTDLDNAHGLRIEVVDASGKSVWSGAAGEPGAGARISSRIETRLRAGIYWIRLYSSAGELLREFGLRAE